MKVGTSVPQTPSSSLFSELCRCLSVCARVFQVFAEHKPYSLNAIKRRTAKVFPALSLEFAVIYGSQYNPRRMFAVASRVGGLLEEHAEPSAPMLHVSSRPWGSEAAAVADLAGFGQAAV